jgi:hypothetical protein
MKMNEFISEDDLNTFEGWLKYQGIDAATTPSEELATWQTVFDEAKERSSATSKVGLMKLQTIPGEYRYAVAVPDGSDLWLALWVRLSPKGEFFVMTPMSDRAWDPHTSYHLDGTFHMKSHDRKMLVQKRQPLLGPFFRGTDNANGELPHEILHVGPQ